MKTPVRLFLTLLLFAPAFCLAQCSGTLMMNITPPGSSCFGTPVTITLSGVAPNWNFKIYKDSIAASSKISNTASAYDTLSSIPHTFYYATADSSGCPEKKDSVSITVKPLPQAAVSGNTSPICSGVKTNVTITSSIYGTTFSWTPSVTTSGDSLTITGYGGGSGATITQKINNYGPMPGVLTYTIIPTYSGCSGSPVMAAVTINPAVSGNASPASVAICSGSNTGIALNSGNVIGTTFTWTNSTVYSITGQSVCTANCGTSINDSLSNIESASGTITYTITPSANGCTGNVFTDVVTVRPVPIAIIIDTTQSTTLMCSGAKTYIPVTCSTSGATFNWSPTVTLSDSGEITGYAQGTGALIAQKIVNYGPMPSTVTYIVSPIYDGCFGPPVTATVTVNPAVSGYASPASVAICSGSHTGITLDTGNASGTTFTWTSAVSDSSNDGQSACVSGCGENINDSLYNTEFANAKITYTITPWANGCSGPTFSDIVTVRPVPVATVIDSPATICSDAKTDIRITSTTSSATFSWSPSTDSTTISGFAAGAGATIAQKIVNYGSLPGVVTYTITPIYYGCSGPPVTAAVTVNPAVTGFASPASVTICSGSFTGITLGTSNAVGTTFTWTNPITDSINYGQLACISACGASINDSLYNTGLANTKITYTITPSANGCSGTVFTDVVTVKPVPAATVIDSPTTICSGAKTDVRISSSTTGATFDWSPSITTLADSATISGFVAGAGAAIAQKIVNYGPMPGVVTYTITPIYNGCSGPPVTAAIIINPAVSGSATPASLTICGGSFTGITLDTGYASGTTFTWTNPVTDSINYGQSACISGCGTSINDSLYNTGFASAKITYTIIPSANGCSGAAFTEVVTVKPVPVASVPHSTIICSGTETNIYITSTTTGAALSWSPSITSLSDSATISGFAGGTGSTIAQTLVNDGSMPGVITYTITPAYNGCSGSLVTAAITVNPAVSGSATPVSIAICSGSYTGITLDTGNAAGTILTWKYSTSGSITGPTICTSDCGTSIEDSLYNTGVTNTTCTYSITPWANGCAGAVFTDTVTVKPLPEASATDSTTICSGIKTNISITSTTRGTTFSWAPSVTTPTDSGTITGFAVGAGATIAQTLVNSGSTPGVVTYTITPTCNGCSGFPVTTVVTVNPFDSLNGPCRNADGITNYISDNLITLFPNPATNQLTIRTSSFRNKTITASVINMLGQETLSYSFSFGEGQGEATIDISKLAAGMYFLQMNLTSGRPGSESVNIVKKFVRE